MNPRIEIRIRRLDAEEVAVCAGVNPAAVGLLALLAEGERYSERVAEAGADGLENALHERGILLRLEFAGLQDDASVAVFRRPCDRVDDLRLAHPVAGDPGVSAADAAVEAVLGADVGEFDESAERDLPSPVGGLGLVRAAHQGGEVRVAQHADDLGDRSLWLERGHGATVRPRGVRRGARGVRRGGCAPARPRCRTRGGGSGPCAPSGRR